MKPAESIKTGPMVWVFLFEVRKGYMKSHLSRFFSMASGIILVTICFVIFNSGIISSLKVEIIRYSEVNIWYLALALIFILGSYYMGWMTSKKHQL